MSDYLTSIAGNSASTATKKPEELANPVLSLGQDPKKATGHVAGDEKSWLDAYGQNEQKSWQDYYEQYKGLFSGDKPGGYGAHAASQGDDSLTNQRYLMNLQQRQMDERMTEYQDWQQKYWDQQNAQNEELMKWLRGEGDEGEAPTYEWYEDPEFQSIAGIYAMSDPQWLGWSQGHDLEGLTAAVGEALSAAYGMTPEERDAAMERFGVTGQEWMMHLMYLARHLGVAPGAPVPGTDPGTDPGQPTPSWRDDSRFQQIVSRYAPVDPDGWGSGSVYQDDATLRQAIQGSLDWIAGMSRADLDRLVGGWGDGYSSQGWLDDLNWLAGNLGLQPGTLPASSWRDDSRFQQIVSRYAPIDPSGWGSGSVYRDDATLRRSVRDSLAWTNSVPRSELDAITRSWGITTSQWLNDLNWLAASLGI